MLDHTTDLMNRGPNAQPFSYEACEFKCAFPDCGEASHDESDLKKCEACGLHACAEHSRTFEELPFCLACCVCVHPGCTRKARGMCAECGDLLCDEHDWDCVDIGKTVRTCRPCSYKVNARVAAAMQKADRERKAAQARPVILQEDGKPVMYKDSEVA